MALEKIQTGGPEEIRKVAMDLLRNPGLVKDIEEEWKDILTLIYFSHFSLITNEMLDLESLAAWSVSSLNAAKLSRKLGLSELEARTLSNAAKALSLMNLSEQAKRAYTEADKIYRKLEMNEENLRGFISNLNDFGAFCIEQEEFETAGKYLEEALQLAEKNRDAIKPSFFAEISSNLGSLSTELRRFDEARTYYTRSEEIFRELSEKDEKFKVELAVLLNNFGAMYREMKRFDEAEAKFDEAKGIFEELAERNEFFKGYLGDTLSNLGMIYKKTGRFDEAEKAFLEDMKLKKELLSKNPAYLKSYAHSLDNLSDFYKEIGREIEAKRYKEEADRIYNKIFSKKRPSKDADLRTAS